MVNTVKKKKIRSKDDKMDTIKYAIVYVTNIVVILYILYIGSTIIVATITNEEIVSNINKGVEVSSELKVSKDNTVFEYKGKEIQVPLSRTYYTRSIGNKEQKVYYNSSKDIVVICLGKWHFLGVASKTPCIFIFISDICLIITDIIDRNKKGKSDIDRRDKILIGITISIMILVLLLTYTISGV